MKNLNGLDWACLILLIIGGLNWGLVGLFGFNLVDMLFGSMMIIAKIIYVLVAISAIYILAISGKLARK